MEGVSGSRQFFDMNSRGGRKLLRAGSSSNILFDLSATFPPLSSSICWHCSFRVDSVYIIYRYFVVLLLRYSFWSIRTTDLENLICATGTRNVLLYMH